MKMRNGHTASVYRKPTHTSRLLNFNSCNPISHKRSVAQTLAARAWTVSSSKAEAIKEIRLVRGVLLKNGYSKGILPTLKEPKRTEWKEPDTLGHCVLPDYPGLGGKDWQDSTWLTDWHSLQASLHHP